SSRRHTRFSRDWSADVCSSDLQFPLQVSDGHFVGVADRNSGTHLTGNLDQALELPIDGLFGDLVVEEYITGQIGDLKLLSHSLCHGLCRGAAVDKIQRVTADLLHGPLHRATVLGEDATSMVVQAAHVGNVAQGFLKSIDKSGLVQI